MRRLQLLSLVLLQQLRVAAAARQPGFSIHQDLLAYPQFEVVISESFITEADAQALLDKAEARSSRSANHAASQTDLAPGSGGNTRDDAGNKHHDDDYDDDDKVTETYEIMSAPPHRYLCAIPIIEAPPPPNKTAAELAKAEEAKELARASSHGWDLINGLEGTCLYYVLGWWSYTFCYGNNVVQFHALPGSVKVGPPVRDPQTMEYVLGRVGGSAKSNARRQQQQQQQKQDRMDHDLAQADADPAEPKTPSQMPPNTELQVKGDQRYMVQKLDSGTICDLTGRERTIEIQYHCSPGATQDRIGWIKEVTTCAYLMVVHTPRLCADVAFLPPKETKANTITCRDIIPEDGAGEWRQRKMIEAQDILFGKGKGAAAGGLGGAGGKAPVTIGGVVVGGRKIFGDEAGRLVAPPRGGGVRQATNAINQVLEVVARGSGKDKTMDVLSDEDLAQLGIDPETLEHLHEEMKKVAGDKEWKIELIEVPGDEDARVIRAVVLDDKPAVDKEGEKDEKEVEDTKDTEGGEQVEAQEDNRVNGQPDEGGSEDAGEVEGEVEYYVVEEEGQYYEEDGEEEGSQEQFYRDEL